MIKENQRKKYLVRLHLHCFFIFKNKFQLYKTLKKKIVDELEKSIKKIKYIQNTSKTTTI